MNIDYTSTVQPAAGTELGLSGNSFTLMKTFTTLVLTLMLLSGFGCATAQNGAISRAQRGIEKRNYEFALRRLSEAEKYVDPKPRVKAEIAYLKGVCYAGLGRSADAKAMFQYVTDNFPDTEFAYQAKAKLAGDQTK